MMRRHFALVLGLCSGLLLRAQERFPETDNLKLFERRSELLSAFWGREMKIEAGVVLPPDWQKSEHLPVCYSIHGFGGSHRASVRQAPQLVEEIKAGKAPRLLYVFLDAQFSLGHHEFADSVNNGPWGRALTEEFVPALEQEFGAFAAPAGRFLTGHSSGGWSSLWLQVTWPTFWNGTWSTAPDSVDFRDFTGIDVYGFDNAYKDPNGAPIMLVRRARSGRCRSRTSCAASCSAVTTAASSPASTRCSRRAGPTAGRCRCSTARPARSTRPWPRRGRSTTSRCSCGATGRSSGRCCRASCTSTSARRTPSASRARCICCAR